MSKPFSFTIATAELSKGLRPSKRTPRNSNFLVECSGAVGRNGVLQSIDELTRLVTTAITDKFPFPQLFVLTNMILVCGRTKIYELVGGSLVLKHTASVGCSTWTVMDGYDYIYMSNGKVVVVRDPATFAYSETTDLPTASSIVNFNGQAIIGAPDTLLPGWTSLSNPLP